MKIEISLKNFSAIREANLITTNTPVFLVAPNKCGKTQILYLLYAVFWTAWRALREIQNRQFDPWKEFQNKARRLFLVGSSSKKLDFSSWFADELPHYEIKIFDEQEAVLFLLNQNHFELTSYPEIEKIFSSEPVFIAPAGLGDYYKGIWSLKKYHPDWTVVPDTVIDFMTNLITSNARSPKWAKEILEILEDELGVSFSVKQERIFVSEHKSKYPIEQAASGLKSLSFLYLGLKHGLISQLLFLDEPEVNLHPQYLKLLAQIIYLLTQKGIKIFVATHSDYLLEAYNEFIKKHDLKADVWVGRITKEGAIYEYYEANKENMIDVSPLAEVYKEILRGIYAND